MNTKGANVINYFSGKEKLSEITFYLVFVCPRKKEQSNYGYNHLFLEFKYIYKKFIIKS